MMEQLLEAGEIALAGTDADRIAFIEEWLPKIVNDMSELEKKLNAAKSLAVMVETQLLEAEAKIKELE